LCCKIGLISASVPNLFSSSRTVPVKLAYTSYESVKENEQDVKEPIKYKATEYEYNAYKTLETAIKNV